MTIRDHIEQIAAAFGDPRCERAVVWDEIKAAADAATIQEDEYKQARNAWKMKRAGEVYGEWGPDFDETGQLNKYFATGDPENGD